MDVTLPALDGTPLAADLHLPPGGAPRATVLLAPAMGVPRRFYRPLGAYLADAGLAVLVPDYRGIGGSAPPVLRGFEASLHDWADLDLRGGVAYLQRRFPGAPMTWFGHSVGGQLLGLVPDPPVRRALMVGSQHGHWRNWPGRARYAMAALWWVAIPTLTTLLGKLPMRRLGGGEDLPAGVAREWARWGRARDYVVGYALRRGPSGFASFRGDLLAYAITDDAYAPPASVAPLVDSFTAARSELVRVAPERVGLGRLGHFGAFREEARPLWEEWREWLAEAAVAEAEAETETDAETETETETETEAETEAEAETETVAAA